jgi:hypothetical protein
VVVHFEYEDRAVHYEDPIGDHVVVHFVYGDLSEDQQESHTFVLILRQLLFEGHYEDRAVHYEDPIGDHVVVHFEYGDLDEDRQMREVHELHEGLLLLNHEGLVDPPEGRLHEEGRLLYENHVGHFEQML